MKISTRVRYGTRLMLELGVHYGKGPILLKDIAAAEDISEKYLSQIIILLRTAGLVRSYRGARGGYVLSKDPADITLKDIVGVLEGGFNLVDCVEKSSECDRSSICVTRDLWSHLGDRVSKTLGEICLKDLVDKYIQKRKRGVTYNI